MKIIEVLNHISRCSIREKFHFYCPGCGGTRAFKALLEGELFKSLYYNPVVVLLIMEMLVFFGTLFYEKYIDKRNQYIKIRTTMNWLILITIVINFVFKNIMLLIWNIDLLGDFS